jgi:hypothetical protein
VAEVRDMEPPRSSSLSVASARGNGVANPAAPGQFEQPDLGPVLVDSRAIVHFLDLDRFLCSFRQYPLENVARELPR